MKQLIVLIATIILGLSIAGTVVGMSGGVTEIAGAVNETISSEIVGEDGALNKNAFK